MKFVTVATHSQGYFEYLLQSCKRNNIHLDILGWGMKFNGWVWRLNLIRNYFNSLDPEEIVCFIDAYDVIILQDISEIEKRFKALDSDIVIAEDFNIDPYREILARWFVFGICNDTRINAGTYIGYVKDIVWMMDTICELNDCDGNLKLDDQKMITDLCIQLPLRFHIDKQKDIFLCMCFKTPIHLAEIYVDNQKMLHYKKKYNPCILHGAGGPKLEQIIDLLGYNIEYNYSEVYIYTPELLKNQLVLAFIFTVVFISLGIILYYLYSKHLTHVLSK